MRRAIVFPSLVLAFGVMASTAVAVSCSASRSLVLAGPLLMALTLLAASGLVRRLGGTPRGTFRVALILGGALIVAGAIVASRDPGRVASLLPILGGAAGASVILTVSPGPAGSDEKGGAAARPGMLDP